MTEKPEQWSCDRCDEPVIMGEDIIYTMVYDKKNKITRHGRCQPSREQLVADMDAAMARANKAMANLRKMIR